MSYPNPFELTTFHYHHHHHQDTPLYKYVHQEVKSRKENEYEYVFKNTDFCDLTINKLSDGYIDINLIRVFPFVLCF